MEVVVANAVVVVVRGKTMQQVDAVFTAKLAEAIVRAMEVFVEKRMPGPSTRYMSEIEACYYTNKTARQLQFAVEKGYLKVCLGKDGTRSYLKCDLDAYMQGDNADQSH